jgi:OmpA-OmpF porin, OOP family
VALDELHQVILEKNMKNIKRAAKTVGALSLVGWAVMTTQFAMAADAKAGWIGGLNVGQSIANIDNVRITADLAATGLATNSMNVYDRATAYKIFGGYKFNKNFALEGGYFDLGRFDFTAVTSPDGTFSGNIKVRGLNFDAVGILPVTPKFSAIGRIGLIYNEAADTFNNTGAVFGPIDRNPSKSAYNYKVGLGLQYDFSDDVGMRGEWERFRVDDAVGNIGEINMYSIGLVVKFGAKPAPAPKAALPPPKPPVLVVVPVVAKTEQYCSILDIQFEINEEEIQREEKEKIAVLATFMNKYPKTTAVIEGHSDDVGSDEENMKLSEQRAQSVVDYLVSAHKIDASRLKAVGYGETRPVADNSTEEGQRENRRINAVVACAPDVEGLKVKAARVTMALEMEFDKGKADIKPQYNDELRRVATYLKANPSVTATVEGHTDDLLITGEKAMVLSERRGQNVVNYLVDNFGVSRSQLGVAAFGESRRFAYNTSLEGREENRRVNIIINYPK